MSPIVKRGKVLYTLHAFLLILLNISHVVKKYSRFNRKIRGSVLDTLHVFLFILLRVSHVVEKNSQFNRKKTGSVLYTLHIFLLILLFISPVDYISLTQIYVSIYMNRIPHRHAILSQKHLGSFVRPKQTI